MANLRRCDRCKSVGLPSIIDFSVCKDGDAQYDLCTDCGRDFDNFIRNLEVKPQEKRDRI